MTEMFVPGLVYMGRPKWRDIVEVAPVTTDVGYVYYLLDSTEDVLYVGQSINPGKRLLQHRKDKPWRHQITWVKVWADYAYAINEVERWQIRKLQPRYNQQFTDTGRPVSAELHELATHLKANPEYVRGLVNGGLCAGELSNWLACEHGTNQQLCGDLVCESRAARQVLALLKGTF